MCKHMDLLTVEALICMVMWICPAFAMESTAFRMERSVVNAAGNTYTGAAKQIYDSLGEAQAGQSFGSRYSVQAGNLRPNIKCVDITPRIYYIYGL